MYRIRYNWDSGPDQILSFPFHYGELFTSQWYYGKILSMLRIRFTTNLLPVCAIAVNHLFLRERERVRDLISFHMCWSLDNSHLNPQAQWRIYQQQFCSFSLPSPTVVRPSLFHTERAMLTVQCYAEKSHKPLLSSCHWRSVKDYFFSKSMAQNIHICPCESKLTEFLLNKYTVLKKFHYVPSTDNLPTVLLTHLKSLLPLDLWHRAVIGTPYWWTALLPFASRIFSTALFMLCSDHDVCLIFLI